MSDHADKTSPKPSSPPPSRNCSWPTSRRPAISSPPCSALPSFSPMASRLITARSNATSRDSICAASNRRRSRRAARPRGIALGHVDGGHRGRNQKAVSRISSGRREFRANAEAVQDRRVAVPPDPGHRGRAQVQAPVQVDGPQRPGHRGLDRADVARPRPRRRRRAGPRHRRSANSSSQAAAMRRSTSARVSPPSGRKSRSRCHRCQTSAGMPPSGWPSNSP